MNSIVEATDIVRAKLGDEASKVLGITPIDPRVALTGASGTTPLLVPFARKAASPAQIYGFLLDPDCGSLSPPVYLSVAGQGTPALRLEGRDLRSWLFNEFLGRARDPNVDALRRVRDGELVAGWPTSIPRDARGRVDFDAAYAAAGIAPPLETRFDDESDWDRSTYELARTSDVGDAKASMLWFMARCRQEDWTSAAIALGHLLNKWHHVWGFYTVDDFYSRAQSVARHAPQALSEEHRWQVANVDAAARITRAKEMLEQGDARAYTKALHDLAYELGEFDGMLPLLAAGFSKMGLAPAVQLCRLRDVSPAVRMSWPMPLDEVS